MSYYAIGPGIHTLTIQSGKTPSQALYLFYQQKLNNPTLLLSEDEFYRGKKRLTDTKR